MYPGRNLFARLFVRKSAPRCAIVLGDGHFGLYVASAAHHRAEIERLCCVGDSTRGDVEVCCPALLIPQPTNIEYGRDAVAVRIQDTTVGYLRPTGGHELLSALRAGNFDRAACRALVFARPDPVNAGRVYHRVRLDAIVPFKLENPPAMPLATGRARQAH
jgi:hypothetical protein